VFCFDKEKVAFLLKRLRLKEISIIIKDGRAYNMILSILYILKQLHLLLFIDCFFGILIIYKNGQAIIEDLHFYVF